MDYNLADEQCQDERKTPSAKQLLKSAEHETEDFDELGEVFFFKKSAF